MAKNPENLPGTILELQDGNLEKVIKVIEDNTVKFRPRRGSGKFTSTLDHNFELLPFGLVYLNHDIDISLHTVEEFEYSTWDGTLPPEQVFPHVLYPTRYTNEEFQDGTGWDGTVPVVQIFPHPTFPTQAFLEEFDEGSDWDGT